MSLSLFHPLSYSSWHNLPIAELLSIPSSSKFPLGWMKLHFSYVNPELSRNLSIHREFSAHTTAKKCTSSSYISVEINETSLDPFFAGRLC